MREIALKVPSVNNWPVRESHPPGIDGLSTDSPDRSTDLTPRAGVVSGRTQSVMEMKVLIQDSRSKLYYAGTECWVPAMAMAWDFKNVVTALNVAVRERLGQINILMYFGNPRYDISLPVATPTANWQSE